MPRILIVDDNRSLGNLLSHWLVTAGFETVVLYDSREVMREIGQSLPDLIIIDATLKVKNQKSLLSQLIKNTKTRELDMIVMTTYQNGFEVDIETSNEHVVMLRKPFDPKDVVILATKFLRSTKQNSSQPAQVRS